MANRNTLAIHKLEEFKAWLDARSIEHRPTTADFQVLQVRLPGDPRWHAVYQKLSAKEHLSVPLPLERLVWMFVTGCDDWHRLRAAEMFNVEPDQVTPEQRRAGKVANFHEMYTPNRHPSLGG